MTSKSPVGDISVFTLIRTDTTLDHSQKAEKVWYIPETSEFAKTDQTQHFAGNAQLQEPMHEDEGAMRNDVSSSSCGEVGPKPA